MTTGAAMPRKLPKYCVEDTDRYGKVRVYLRRPGNAKVRIEGVPWSPGFMEIYRAALDGLPVNVPMSRREVREGSWRWLCQQYLASDPFTKLDAVTQTRRRALLETTYLEPTKPGAATLYADFPVARMTVAAVRVLRDRKADTPEGANNRLKAIRAVFKWATSADVELALHNPARDVGKIVVASEGYHTWTVPEVRQFVLRHPLGTQAHLAMCILLFGGGRRSDAVALGPQHIQGGAVRYTQHKGRNTNPMAMDVPVLPGLRSAIEACPSGHLTFLVTSFGKPFTSNGFGNKVREWCDAAGLPHCSAHGLRKAGATLAAENGATVKQLMAMFGWRTPQMAELYTKKAERKRLAAAAMHLIDFERPEVPLGSRSATLLDYVENSLALSAT